MVFISKVNRLTRYYWAKIDINARILCRHGKETERHRDRQTVRINQVLKERTSAM